MAPKKQNASKRNIRRKIGVAQRTRKKLQMQKTTPKKTPRRNDKKEHKTLNNPQHNQKYGKNKKPKLFYYRHHLSSRHQFLPQNIKYLV